jgi:hypothetical protein
MTRTNVDGFTDAELLALVLSVRCPECHHDPGVRCDIRNGRWHRNRLRKAAWRKRGWWARPHPASDRFVCVVCGKAIAKARPHMLTDTDVVCCVNCITWDSRDAHAVCYPDCGVDWHDMYDHQHISCTLAGLRWTLRKGGYATIRDKAESP